MTAAEKYAELEAAGLVRPKCPECGALEQWKKGVGYFSRPCEHKKIAPACTWVSRDDDGRPSCVHGPAVSSGSKWGCPLKSRTRHKAKRTLYRANGVCTSCKASQAVEGYANCEACRNRFSLYWHQPGGGRHRRREAVAQHLDDQIEVILATHPDLGRLITTMTEGNQ